MVSKLVVKIEAPFIVISIVVTPDVVPAVDKDALTPSSPVFKVIANGILNFIKLSATVIGVVSSEHATSNARLCVP